MKSPAWISAPAPIVALVAKSTLASVLESAREMPPPALAVLPASVLLPVLAARVKLPPMMTRVLAPSEALLWLYSVLWASALPMATPPPALFLELTVVAGFEGLVTLTLPEAGTSGAGSEAVAVGVWVIGPLFLPCGARP